MPRGQKECKNCGAFTGPRTKICDKCNTPFIIKGSTEVSSPNDYLSNDSVSFDSEIHFETKTRKCALCEFEYSCDFKHKDCYGNLVYEFKNGLYCSVFCLRQASNIIGKAALKIRKNQILTQEETELFSIIEKRENEISEFEKHLTEYPSVKFKIRPDKALAPRTKEDLVALGLKTPIRSDYQPKVEENVDDDFETPIGFADLIETEKEETVQIKTPLIQNQTPASTGGFGALISGQPVVKPSPTPTVSVSSNEKDPGRGPGRKQCKNCKFHIGVRSQKCKFCEHNC